MRARLIYSKRDGACFVPHIALAQMFSRSASRAGLKLIMTQGFSPRAKISFGPELPAGVIALNEPVDMFFHDTNNDIIDIMNSSLPEGFRISRVIYPPEDSPSLGKICRSAEYLIRSTTNINLTEHIRNFYNDYVVSVEDLDGWHRLILNDPARNAIGSLVRYMMSENIISGWHEINIVRVSIGIYDPDKGGVFMNA